MYMYMHVHVHEKSSGQCQKKEDGGGQLVKIICTCIHVYLQGVEEEGVAQSVSQKLWEQCCVLLGQRPSCLPALTTTAYLTLVDLSRRE